MELEYILPDFAAPQSEDNMEGVVPFYSSVQNKIYFIYSSIDSIHQMASCYLSDPYECTVEPLSKFYLDFFGFKKNSIADARVYDELHLVGIPSLNSCVPTQYYVFDSMLLVNKISTLGSIATFCDGWQNSICCVRAHVKISKHFGRFQGADYRHS